MSKYLIIAGHGRRRNGTFDPGATGLIKMGEHNYMKNILFPAMKKYADNNFIFYSTRNVYSHGDIVALARKYGRNTKVVECHFDYSSNELAKGGHVIINSQFSPDKMDLRLRDVIDKHLGLRYNHRGHKGISGRSNLANVNRTANNNVNYRMLELGFGTNKSNVNTLINKTDELAKDLVKAIQGKPVSVKPSQPKPQVNSIERLVEETKVGLHGNGADRQRSLGKNYHTVQNIINSEAFGKPTPQTKSIDELIRETKAGLHGNGEQRKKSLGVNYHTVQNTINKEAFGGKRKSTSELVDEVNRGLHGNGDARKRSLGSRYQEVQNEINRRYG